MGGAGQPGKGKRPINVKFEIPYFTTSGIQVRYLKIIEPKVSNAATFYALPFSYIFPIISRDRLPPCIPFPPFPFLFLGHLRHIAFDYHARVVFGMSFPTAPSFVWPRSVFFPSYGTPVLQLSPPRSKFVNHTDVVVGYCRYTPNISLAYLFINTDLNLLSLASIFLASLGSLHHPIGGHCCSLARGPIITHPDTTFPNPLPQKKNQTSLGTYIPSASL